MSRGPRVEYATAARAARAAAEIVMGDPSAPESAVRVMFAVTVKLSLYSRLRDDVSRAELAELAGVSERTVTRALTYLASVGLVDWQPGHRGRTGTLTITAKAQAIEEVTPHGATVEGRTGPDSGTQPCPAMDAGNDRIAGHREHDSETQLCPNSETQLCPSPEKVPEKTSEKREGEPESDPITRVISARGQRSPENIVEFRQVVENFSTIHGADVFAQAMDDMPGLSLDWASDLKSALRVWIDRHPARVHHDQPPAPPAPPPLTADPNCPDCHGDGITADHGNVECPCRRKRSA
jgi:hypothetical protein